MELLNPLISEYTWANKPSVAPLGQIICVTDVGENGILCRGDGAKFIRLNPVNFYSLASSLTVTGTTAETTLLATSIPAGFINKRGRLNVLGLMILTNNANLKTLKVKFGGQTLATVTSTSQAALGFSIWLLTQEIQSRSPRLVWRLSNENYCSHSNQRSYHSCRAFANKC
jgi:hypothetical protein